MLILLGFLVVDQEWFLERYHPKNEESTRNAKVKWIESELAVFAKQLRTNPRQFIASASLDPISEVCSQLVCGLSLELSKSCSMVFVVAMCCGALCCEHSSTPWTIIINLQVVRQKTYDVAYLSSTGCRLGRCTSSRQSCAVSPGYPHTSRPARLLAVSKGWLFLFFSFF